VKRPQYAYATHPTNAKLIVQIHWGTVGYTEIRTATSSKKAKEEVLTLNEEIGVSQEIAILLLGWSMFDKWPKTDEEFEKRAKIDTGEAKHPVLRPSEALNRAVDRTGWTPHNQLEVLLGYLEKNADVQRFQRYVESLAAEELQKEG